MKKVSLILTTYNCKANLEITLRSIESQNYPEVEVIIKDGGSTDGTLDIVKAYEQESKYPVIWKTESDMGIYDAMNQGYALCTGDIIVCFNDVFVDSSVISKMVQLIESDSKCVGAHADLIYKDGDKVIRKWHMGKGKLCCGWMPGHPTLFMKREIYEKYGVYHTDFKIAADYEFMIRFLKDKENYLVYLNEPIVSMFYGGTSSGGLKNYLESFAEGYKALRMNGFSRVVAVWITGMRTVRVLLQFG